MDDNERFHCCCYGGVKRLDKHWLLWGRPRSRFPLQGMVGPDWRVGAWTFVSITAGTVGWGCLIIFGAPDDGADMLRTIIVAIGGGLALVTMAFYLSTACTDPGIVFKHKATPVRGTPAAGHGPGGSGGRSALLALSAGAGTPVPTAGGGDGVATGGKGGATVAVARGGAEEGKDAQGVGATWGTEDVEAQQILDILEDDYREGVKSHEVATVAAAGEGLPPEDCAAAADAGSNAVADMRNVPPPEEAAAFSSPRQRGSTVGGGNSATICGRCQIERPPGAVHCNLCGVCVQKLDHHCPFMGQCVGRKTLVPFYLFVVSVWSLIVYVLLAVAYLVVAVLSNGL
ncbi:unnamed protein product [Ectocarpus sp. CCAP 1310/34]|nr:unnamed protein product [Ectocarpus sp. CCAP 1310/34]